jgi:hypothetical protein
MRSDEPIITTAYTNDDLGLTLQLPAGWREIKPAEYAVRFGTAAFFNPDLTPPSRILDRDGMIVLHFLPNQHGQSTAARIVARQSDLEISPARSISIAGLAGIEQDLWFSSSPQPNRIRSVVADHPSGSTLKLELIYHSTAKPLRESQLLQAFRSVVQTATLSNRSR